MLGDRHQKIERSKGRDESVNRRVKIQEQRDISAISRLYCCERSVFTRERLYLFATSSDVANSIGSYLIHNSNIFNKRPVY